MSPRNKMALNVTDVDPNTFGGILRRAREDAGLSQAELGELVGSPQSRISLYERGKNMPGEDVVLKLAEALGISAGLLFEASQFGTVVVLGEERRKRMAGLREDDWRFFDQALAVMEDLAPEERETFQRRVAQFLTGWRGS